MRHVFADSSYWIALESRRDSLHVSALIAAARLGDAVVITTDAVLLELLNYFSASGGSGRHAAASSVHAILSSPSVEVVELNRVLFLAGLELYEARLDKGYSLVDCISMNVMRERGIAEVLTHDHHFAQEGFTLLL